ncbi:MAG: KTSC domain-containing protein [Myxococcota bacterium]
MLRPVQSSMVHAVGYNRQTKVLEVVFNGGGVYFYVGVPRRVHHELMHAESMGRYLNAHIKDVYPCYRLKGEKGGPVLTEASSRPRRSQRPADRP